MSELQDEMSPLQVGTSGVFEGKPFDLIGRLKVNYSDGTWNEWYSIFSDGREGWLAEAQGFLAMCFPVNPKDAHVPDSGKLTPGMQLRLYPHGEFLVEDIRDVVCRFSEGELPMNAMKGRESKSVDLRGAGAKMATIEYACDGTRIYAGAYQDFDSFKFKHLREIDGW